MVWVLCCTVTHRPQSNIRMQMCLLRVQFIYNMELQMHILHRLRPSSKGGSNTFCNALLIFPLSGFRPRELLCKVISFPFQLHIVLVKLHLSRKLDGRVWNVEIENDFDMAGWRQPDGLVVWWYLLPIQSGRKWWSRRSPCTNCGREISQYLQVWAVRTKYTTHKSAFLGQNFHQVGKSLHTAHIHKWQVVIGTCRWCKLSEDFCSA